MTDETAVAEPEEEIAPTVEEDGEDTDEEEDEEDEDEGVGEGVTPEGVQANPGGEWVEPPTVVGLNDAI